MQLNPDEREDLVFKVIGQIRIDIYEGAYEALFEMLEQIDPRYLIGFLEEAEHYEKLRWN